MDDRSARAILVSLATNRVAVRRLLLGGNYITDASLKELRALLAASACSELTFLSLRNNRFSSQVLVTLEHACNGLPNLRRLDLSHNGLQSGGVGSWKALQLIQTLNRIDISANQLGDSGCESVCLAAVHLPSLDHLNLSRCCFSQESGRYLGQLIANSRSLWDLNVGGNALGDVGASVVLLSVAKSVSLSVLDLHDTQLTDRIVPYVVFNLQRTKRHPSGRTLASTNTIGSGLRELRLSRNNLSPFALSELVSCLALHPLRFIDLNDILADKQQCQAIRQALSNIPGQRYVCVQRRSKYHHTKKWKKTIDADRVGAAVEEDSDMLTACTPAVISVTSSGPNQTDRDPLHKLFAILQPFAHGGSALSQEDSVSGTATMPREEWMKQLMERLEPFKQLHATATTTPDYQTQLHTLRELLGDSVSRRPSPHESKPMGSCSPLTGCLGSKQVRDTNAVAPTALSLPGTDGLTTSSIGFLDSPPRVVSTAQNTPEPSQGPRDTLLRRSPLSLLAEESSEPKVVRYLAASSDSMALVWHQKQKVRTKKWFSCYSSQHTRVKRDGGQMELLEGSSTRDPRHQHFEISQVTMVTESQQATSGDDYVFLTSLDSHSKLATDMSFTTTPAEMPLHAETPKDAVHALVSHSSFGSESVSVTSAGIHVDRTWPSRLELDPTIEGIVDPTGLYRAKPSTTLFNDTTWGDLLLEEDMLEVALPVPKVMTPKDQRQQRKEAARFVKAKSKERIRLFRREARRDVQPS
eukprot:GILK01015609.1.p1 GENE.GILK01015609.1~~GILK01015609.1.p1  ORF type:complete len:761 (-),score=79.81 GILK01015609.1:188-2446(-)